MCHVIPLFFKLLGSALVLHPEWDDKQLKRTSSPLLVNARVRVNKTVSAVGANNRRRASGHRNTQDREQHRGIAHSYNRIRDSL